MKPTVGRIVHVTHRGTLGCNAAIVTSVGHNYIGLVEFRDPRRYGEPVVATSFAAEGAWHWPEREQELEAERKEILGNLVDAAYAIEAIGAEPEPVIRRRQVVAVDDVVEEIRQRADAHRQAEGGVSVLAAFAAADALERMIDWLDAPIEPAPEEAAS